MSLFESCNFSDDLEFRHHAPGFRIFSLIFAILGHLLVAVCLIWWHLAKKKLIYLKKRGFGNALLTSLGMISVLHVGFVSSVPPVAETYFEDCFLRNLVHLATVPIFVLGQLNCLLYFKWRAAYSAKVATREDHEELHWWYSLLQNSWFESGLTISSFILVLSGLSIIATILCSFCYPIRFNDIPFFVGLFLTDVPLLIKLFLTYIKLKTYPDPFKILEQLTIGLQGCVVYSIAAFSAAALVQLLYVRRLENEEDLRFDGKPLIALAIFIYYIYFIPYQIYLAYRFDEREAIHTDITLKRVLDDPTGHNLLKKYLITEFSVENILFMDALRNVKEMDEINVKEELEMIYKEFIKSKILNISSRSYGKLEDAHHNDDISIDSFLGAEQEIYQLVEFDSFSRFKHSTDFKQYVGLIRSNKTV